MDFCISSQKLGTKENLLITEDGFQWIPNIPIDTWVFSNQKESKSIEKLARLFKKDIVSFWDSPHAVFFKKINVPLENVNWNQVLNSEEYATIIKSMIETIQELVGRIENSEFKDHLQKIDDLFECLDRAKINKMKLMRCLNFETNESQKTNLKSFQVDSSGLAKKVTYDPFSTATGRMIVKDGPKILTLKKDYRSIIESRYGKDGMILSIDFVSLEPRVAMAVAGISPEKDIYNWIDEKIFESRLGRSKAKITTLSLIYGMSLMRANSQGGVTPEEMRKLKSIFGIEAIEDRLKEDFANNDVKNFFGRPIYPESEIKLFNSFVQSTAVSVSIEGFLKVINTLKKNNVEFKSLFLIHDELIIDTRSKDAGKIREILKSGIEITKLGNFPVDIEILVDSYE